MSSPVPPQVPCKGCGKPIVWVKVTDDKGNTINVPLDPRPPVYRIEHIDNVGSITCYAKRDKEAMVSHFATCPKANEFSGRAKTK